MTTVKTYVYASKDRSHDEFFKIMPLVIKKLKARGLDNFKVSSSCNSVSIRYVYTDESIPRSFWIAAINSTVSLDLTSRKYKNEYRDIMIITTGLLNKKYALEFVGDEIIIELLNILNECVEEFYAGSLTTFKELFQQHYDAGCKFKLPHKAYAPPEYVTQDYYVWQTNRLNRELLELFGDSNYSISNYEAF